MFLRKILFLIFIHCFISGKSQEYTVQLKSFSPILISEKVADYEIDNNKNLWVFSNTGFIKYDGCNIIKFKADFKGRTLEKVSRAGKYLLILFSNGNLVFFDTDTYKYLDLKKYRVLDICYYNGYVYMLHPGYVIQKYPLNNLNNPVQSIKIGKGFNYIRYGDNQIFVSRDGIFVSFSQRGIYKIEREKYYPLLTGSHINGDSRYNEGFKELHGKTYFVGLEHTYEYNPSTKTLEKTSDKKKRTAFCMILTTVFLMLLMKVIRWCTLTKTILLLIFVQKKVYFLLIQSDCENYLKSMIRTLPLLLWGFISLQKRKSLLRIFLIKSLKILL
ncbi:hypothetical protein CRDW_11340 [Chryseobacterium gambrini]|uniref:Uncharacterized protein n=1 Tax=Chryseobacterium gambrini TaxID=373672 RepID=A0ABN7CBL1_9FLAO|nr:hypothetical protein CRDW_11340 [Chryseobacterium gambrini]